MKVKVITYKANGNDLIEKTVEVTRYTSNVYVGKEKGDYFPLYLGHNGIYVLVADIYKYNFTEEKKAEIESLTLDVSKCLLNSKWVNSAILEFAKQTGLHYEELKEKREQLIQQREIEAKERERLKAEREAEKKREYDKHMNNLFNILKSGETIKADDLMDLTRHFKFKAHPRTLGTINKMSGVIGVTSASKPKGMSWNTHSSIINLAKELVEYVETESQFK